MADRASARTAPSPTLGARIRRPLCTALVFFALGIMLASVLALVRARENERYRSAADGGAQTSDRVAMRMPTSGHGLRDDDQGDLTSELRSSVPRDPRAPWTTFLVGTVASFLLAILVFLRRQAGIRAQEAQEAIARRSAIVDCSGDAIIGESLDGIITDWNAGAERLFGYPASTAIGRRVADLLLPAERAREDAALRAIVAGGALVPTYETTRARADGSLVAVAVTASPISLPNGTLIGMSKTLRDISEAKDASQRLVEAQQKLEAEIRERAAMLQTALRDGDALLSTIKKQAIVSVTDARGRIVEVNDAFCAISGYTREELLGKTHAIINSGVQDRSFWEDVWRTISKGFSWRGEVCNRAKDGSLYWVDSIIAPYSGEDGRIQRYVSIRTDITAAKAIERRLRESESLLDRAGKAANIGAWQVDLRTNTVMWSDAMYRIRELDRSFVPTLTNTLSMCAAGSRQALEAALRTAIESGVGWDLELASVTGRGRPLWIRLVGEVEFEDGQPARLIGTMQDVTARKDAERSLARERQLLSSLLDSLPDEVRIKDDDGRFLRINRALARRYGLADPSEAIGKREDEFVSAAEAERSAAIEREILANGRPVLDVEEETLTASGSSRWQLKTQMPLDDGSGNVIGTFGIARDISERKQLEMDLLRSHERIAMATEGGGIGVWEFDVTKNTIVWDDWMYRLHGRTPREGELPATVWAASVHPDDGGRVAKETQDAIAGTRKFDTEYRIVMPTGETRHIKAAAQVVRDSAGNALRMFGVNFDVTERRRAEVELQQTSSLLQTVLASTSEVAIIATDPSFTVTIFNDGAERLLGYASEEIVGRHTPALFHSADEIRLRAEELSTRTGARVEDLAVFGHPLTLGTASEWTYVCKSGQSITVLLAITAMHDANGDLYGYACVAHNVTQRKAREESLREAKRQAEDASLAKSRFLANMSHEIRTPMNAIMGLSYLLGQSALDSEQAALVSKVHVASRSLLALINDILDFSKIEAGELKIERAPFDLRRLLAQVKDIAKMQSDAKQVRLDFDVDLDVPSGIAGDATRTNQILTNLLSNAIKFTERGRVTLRVKRVPGDAGSARLRFDVQDTGIGIPPDVQKRLFAPFAQADASTTRRFGGTGLGLSIVKRLAELMGGTVQVESEEGVGSTFSVTVPFDVVKAPIPTIHEPSASGKKRCRLLGRRVLVVDDSEINLIVAKRILELDGAAVSLARNGQEGFELLRTTPMGYDIVLMDLQMPVLDGCEATSKIRAELPVGALPIVALTADARTTEKERTQAAGMNDFISKPFEVEAVVETIKRHVPSHRPPVVRSLSPTGFARGPVWPIIDGIDAYDIRRRLANDLDTFWSLLRLLSEHHPNASLPPEGQATASGWALHAREMHKLKGAAGSIGAKRLEELAQRTQEAAEEAREHRVRVLTEEVSIELERILHSARAHRSAKFAS